MARRLPDEAHLIERIRNEYTRRPDVKFRDHVILKLGPISYKVAYHLEIHDRVTHQFHHHSVHVDTWRRQADSWERVDRHSITLDKDESSDELGPLLALLAAVRDGTLPDETGNYVVAPLSSHTRRQRAADLYQMLTVLQDEEQAAFLADLLRLTRSDPQRLRHLVKAAENDPDGSRQAAAALNVGRFRAALAALQALVETDAREQRFQALLTEHPWMFGSEYSELLPQRTFVLGHQQDFVFRRTADLYLEVVEIKTPLAARALFPYDASHDTYYEGQALSVALAQLTFYLDELEAHRMVIKGRDGQDIDFHKVRGKLIIGRDGAADQVARLRALNGRLHGIEVLTFDQLLRIARRVVGYLEDVLQNPGGNESSCGWPKGGGPD